MYYFLNRKYKNGSITFLPSSVCFMSLKFVIYFWLDQVSPPRKNKSPFYKLLGIIWVCNLYFPQLHTYEKFAIESWFFFQKNLHCNLKESLKWSFLNIFWMDHLVCDRIRLGKQSITIYSTTFYITYIQYLSKQTFWIDICLLSILESLWCIQYEHSITLFINTTRFVFLKQNFLAKRFKICYILCYKKPMKFFFLIVGT